MIDELRTVAVIDDDLGARESLKMLLKDEFSILSFSSPGKALGVLLSAPREISLVFVDIRMPEFDGLEFLSRVKASNPEIEVVIITAFPSTETAVAALRAGAMDYVVKPFDRDEVLRIARRAVESRSASLENTRVLRSLKDEMRRNYIGTTEALIQTIDAKDSYTRGHSERVADMMLLLSREVGLADDRAKKYYLLARLHDIGKIGISEAVLRKPSPLTPGEWAQMKQHPIIGYNILQPVEFLHDALDLVLYHHERFDGKGYPTGAKGSRIPVGARLIAIVDSVDAMISERSYTRRKSLDEALNEVAAFAGTQFDPELAEIALPLMERQLRNRQASAPVKMSVAG